MRLIEKDVAEDDTFYKVIIFYDLGLPRVHNIPSEDDPRKFIRDHTKSLSISVSVLGWAIIDPYYSRVLRSEGLNTAMYDEIDSLLGCKFKREELDAYEPGENEREKEIPMGEPKDVPVFQIRTYQRGEKAQ